MTSVREQSDGGWHCVSNPTCVSNLENIPFQWVHPGGKSDCVSNPTTVREQSDGRNCGA